MALAIIVALSLVGYALLPRLPARLAIPLSLSLGTLATGWAMWIAGTLVSTRASFVVAAALLLVSLRALPRWWRDCRRVGRELAALGRRWSALLLAIPLALAVPQLLLPIVDSDGLRYHAAFPKLFRLTGRVFFYPWDVTGAFPQTAEMIYMLRPESAKLIHFCFFLATLATLALAVHRRRRDRIAAVIAPFLLAASPVVLAPAAAAFIDHVALFHVAVAMHLVLSRRTPALPLAGAFATKYTAAPALVLAAAVTGPSPRARGEGGAKRRVRGAILTCVAVTVAFAPFALRNVKYTSDPIYPIGHVLLKKPLPGIAPGALAYATQFHSKVEGVVGIPWTTQETAPSDEVVGLHHLLGLFALLIVIREKRLRPAATLVFVYLLVAAIYRVPARYLLPMIFALAILEAAALTKLPKKFAPFVAFVLCVPSLLASAEVLTTFAEPFVYLRHRLDREHYLARVVPGYRAAQAVNALPPGGRVMALDFPAPYYFDRPWIVEGVLHEPPLVQWLRDGIVMAKLRQYDVRILVLTPAYRKLVPPAPFRLVRTVDGVDVYAVSR